MPIKPKQLLPVSALVLALAVTGCASAAGASTTTTAALSRNTHLTLYSVNSDGPVFQAIVTGAIGDDGRAVSVYPDGRVDPGHEHDLRLELARGSFLLNGAVVDKRFVSALRHAHGNPATCSTSATVTAAAPVVAGSGAGAYRGVTGTFTLTAAVDEIDTKSTCTTTGKFIAQVIVITGSGTIRFG